MTPQPKPADLLKDPNFTGLPMAEQRKVLGRLDPNYAALPLAEQNKVLGSTGASGDWEAAPQKPKTASEKIARIGAGAMDTLFPGHDQGKTRGERFLHGAEGAVKGLFDLGGMNGDLLPTDREGKPQVDVTGGVGQLIKEDPYRAVGQALPLAASAFTGGEVNLAGRARGASEAAVEGGSAARAVASKIPEVHPVAKFLAKRIPGVGTALDVLELLKKQYGPSLEAVPKAGRDELANQLYKETHGVEPKTATEQVKAIQELKEKLKAPKEPKAVAEKKIKIETPKWGTSGERVEYPAPEPPKPPAPPPPAPKWGTSGDLTVYGEGQTPTGGFNAGGTTPTGEIPKPPRVESTPKGEVGDAAQSRANVLIEHGAAKNSYLAQRFIDAGLSPEQVEGMADSAYETHMLDEGQKLVKRGVSKRGYTKYKPESLTSRPYKIQKIEVANTMREMMKKGEGQ